MKSSLLKVAGILSIASVASLGTLAYTKAEGNQITVCVKNDGLMYVIGGEFKKSECKKNDSLLSWNIEGIQGPKGDKGDVGLMGPTGPQGPKGDSVAQFHLYDANNQDLGILQRTPSADDQLYYTFLPDLGIGAYFKDKDNNPASQFIKAGPISALYFTNDECTGDMFGGNLPTLTLIGARNGKFYTTTSDVLIPRVARSMYDDFGVCVQVGPSTIYSTFLLKEVVPSFSDIIIKPLHVGL